MNSPRPENCPRRELAVVMPVYNGEAHIAGVLGSWRAALERLGIDFQLIVLNDGSRDRTGELLEAFRSDDRITLINKPNEGHGPTILRGYALAAERAEWVFQTDSDDEIPADGFAALWERRRGFDAVFGERAGRVQPAGRKLISAFARASIRFLFGGSVTDVNTPFRLLRAEVLAPLLRDLPADTFAPNVLITGLLALARARVLNVPVACVTRESVSPSLKKWRLCAVALRCLVQTARCRLRRVRP